jgi:hypothetical protein
LGVSCSDAASIAKIRVVLVILIKHATILRIGHRYLSATLTLLADGGSNMLRDLPNQFVFVNRIVLANALIDASRSFLRCHAHSPLDWRAARAVSRM